MSGAKHRNITINESSLKYTIWPGGSKVLLCFHGFGQDHSVYKSLSQKLKDTHTLYSFDLPYHGQTKFSHPEKPLLPKDWLEFLYKLIELEGLEQFEVMGFSMGGKYAMITAELFPARIEHIHLLAPDGITTHFSYRFSTYPFLFRKIFKTQIKHPWVFNTLVKTLRNLRLMNNYTLRFAESQMDTETKRSQVYYAWVGLRHFMPNLKQLAEQINQHHTPITFYLGKHDKVINTKEIKPLTELITNYELKELESGHSRLINAL